MLGLGTAWCVSVEGLPKAVLPAGHRAALLLWIWGEELRKGLLDRRAECGTCPVLGLGKVSRGCERGISTRAA